MNLQLLYQCVVLNVDDPLMLGRIRARRLIDNYQDELQNAISDPPWNEEKDQWTERDPFIFLPLLPYYLYQTPKVDEMVMVMYVTPDVKYSNKFYVQSTFYSPTSTNFQYFQGGNKFLGTGVQISNPKPLKNSNGTYADKQLHKGVFPEPGDNALLGRGSADVVVKQDEVLIRAGKFRGANLKPNVLPNANQQRGFLQISRFDSYRRNLPNKKVTFVTDQSLSVKYLIEYHISNPENQFDLFNGYVFLYQLKPSIETSSVYLTVGSKLQESSRSIVSTESFVNLSISEVISFINSFINVCNSQNVADDGTQLFRTDDKFPILYRPQNSDYNLMTTKSTDYPKSPPDIECQGNLVTNNERCFLELKLVNTTKTEDVFVKQTDTLCEDIQIAYDELVHEIMTELIRLDIKYVPIPTLNDITEQTLPSKPDYSNLSSGIVQKNLSKIYNGIRLNSSSPTNGWGLIWKKDTVGTPTKIETKEVPQTEILSTYSTLSALGSDFVYLLSHQSSIPGKGKINFDDTLYGISQEKLFEEIEPKTSSLVRGEELLEILDLIVKVLTTHTHAFPGRGPSGTTTTGIPLKTLTTAMNNATNSVLNKFIRLN